MEKLVSQDCAAVDRAGTPPQVSVLLPVYNGMPWIRDAVESILKQTFTDFELLIVDDGSTDGTAQVLDGYRDPRIVRLLNERNQGLIAALNMGLAAARGEWIARMDADDVSKPDRLARQMAFLATHTEISVLGCCMEEVDASGKMLRRFGASGNPNLVAWQMLFDTAIAHATVVMRKSLVLEAGGYSPDYRHVEDVELWSRFWGRVQCASLPDVLYVRRWHPESVCSQNAAHQIQRAMDIRRGMWERLLGRKIAPEIGLAMSAALCPVLTHDQIRSAMLLVLELRDAYGVRVELSDDDRAMVRDDVRYRLVEIAQRNGYIHPSEARNYWKRFIPRSVKVAIKQRLWARRQAAGDER